MEVCDKCGTALEIGMFPFCRGNATDHGTSSIGVVGDDIPGGIEIRHGLVNPDGSPRKFYSKTDIHRAANEAGLKLDGDTPGQAYKVRWSGRRTDAKEN